MSARYRTGQSSLARRLDAASRGSPLVDRRTSATTFRFFGPPTCPYDRCGPVGGPEGPPDRPGLASIRYVWCTTRVGQARGPTSMFPLPTPGLSSRLASLPGDTRFLFPSLLVKSCRCQAGGPVRSPVCSLCIPYDRFESLPACASLCAPNASIVSLPLHVRYGRVGKELSGASPLCSNPGSRSLDRCPGAGQGGGRLHVTFACTSLSLSCHDRNVTSA